MGSLPNKSLSSSVAKRTAIRQQLGVGGVGKSEASVNKPGTIIPADQTAILKTISDAYTLQMTDGKMDNVGTFFTILETLSQDSSLSKDTKAYITQIKSNFETVKTGLQDKSPIDKPIIAMVLPYMLDGIHQLFDFVSVLDDTGKNKPSFQKIANVALECKTKFQAEPAKSRMINHVKNKLDYFLKKDDSSPLSNADPLLSIAIFADVDSNLQRLLQPPTATAKPVIPIPPQRDETQGLKDSPIVKTNWVFSEGTVFGSQNRLQDALGVLAFTADTPVTPGNFLKNDSRITDEALEQIKRLTEENMRALDKNEQQVLLENLAELKKQFDLSYLGLNEENDEDKINEKINELDETDIRKVVQGKIELLNSLITSSSK
ncbi:MAG: hypothetical protein VXX85_05575 [Candidatus Margulisiibacteriota bacterium]|nr:hypothetical protein [Candidatus Margulisiibacteriota bacterium]